MSPDELDASLPLRRNRRREDGSNDDHDKSRQVNKDDIESSAPRMHERMIKSNLPAYSPLTVSRQKNGITDGGDGQTHEGRNTLSVSMSNTSSSAFNAHSPPYIRRGHRNGGGNDTNKDTSQPSYGAENNTNLDIEDIYDEDGRKSVSDVRPKANPRTNPAAAKDYGTH